MRLFLCVMYGFFYSISVFSQAKQPTIMVVPSDAWCNLNGYVQKIDSYGNTVVVPDYKAALQNSPDLLLVISKINELMADRGFPLVNLETVMKRIETQMAEDRLREGRDGGNILETPIDLLKKVAKADIWIQVTWTENIQGPKKSVTINLQGVDTYTGKQIAGASGTGQPSFSADLPVLIEESILANLDLFNAQLGNFFSELFEKGREIIFSVNIWDDWEYDLESEDFGNEELGLLIERWVENNTIDRRYSVTDYSETFLLFEQVRIPLYNDKGRALDARLWASELKKILKNQWGIDSKLTVRGLGQVQLILGDK